MRNLAEYPITQSEKERALERAIKVLGRSGGIGDIDPVALRTVLDELRQAASVALTERQWLLADNAELEAILAKIPEENAIERHTFQSRLDRNREKLAALGETASED